MSRIETWTDWLQRLCFNHYSTVFQSSLQYTVLLEVCLIYSLSDNCLYLCSVNEQILISPLTTPHFTLTQVEEIYRLYHIWWLSCCHGVKRQICTLGKWSSFSLPVLSPCHFCLGTSGSMRLRCIFFCYRVEWPHLC